jgi:hypothetical protein
VTWLWLGVLLGGGLLIWQLVKLVDAVTFRRRSVLTEGRVVHLRRERRTREDDGLWQTDEVDVPIVEFTDGSDTRRRVVMTESDVTRGSLKINSTVTVRYDPRNPARAIITGARLSPIGRHALGTAVSATIFGVAVWVVNVSM